MIATLSTATAARRNASNYFVSCFTCHVNAIWFGFIHKYMCSKNNASGKVAVTLAYSQVQVGKLVLMYGNMQWQIDAGGSTKRPGAQLVLKTHRACIE